MRERLAIVEEFDYMITVRNVQDGVRLNVVMLDHNETSIWITNPQHLEELARQLLEAKEEMEK